MPDFTQPATTATGSPVEADSPLVDAPCGPVVGTVHPRDSRLKCFHAIPYGQAPVGADFLASPKPHSRWEAPRLCDHPGPTPQRRPYTRSSVLDEPSIAPRPGESILNLTVTVSNEVLARREGTKGIAGAPVMVWIHGGGFKSGVAHSALTDPWRFAQAGVVCVSISYRLGFEGFGWVEGLPTNRGLRDQQLALRWVQLNIAAFGGDPNRVTIAGHSAGGGSVLAHLVSPNSTALFNRALSVSGVLPTLTSTEAARRSAIFLDELGRRHGSDSALTASQLLQKQPDRSWIEAEFTAEERIFARPADPVMFIAERLARKPMSDLPFMPFVDGELLPRSVEQSLLDGQGADIALMFTYTSEEFTDICANFTEYFAGFDALSVLQAAGMRQADKYFEEHRHLPLPLLVGQLISDVFFPQLAEQLRCARTRAGGRTEVHEFTWSPARETSQPLPPLQRYSRHGMDLPFAFDTVDTTAGKRLVGDHPNRDLVEQTHQQWLRFITTA